MGLSPTCVLYGIKNCDSIKKARAWLAQQGVAYEFYDYKVSGVEINRLQAFVARVGWESLLNRAGTTFRGLPESTRLALDERQAIRLMLAQPSMIKRPVLEHGGELLVGFTPERYAAHFGANRAL